MATARVSPSRRVIFCLTGKPLALFYYDYFKRDNKEGVYYAYLWSEMLDDDAFAWFTEHGGLRGEPSCSICRLDGV